MFLHELKEGITKAFFMECACLVAMMEGESAVQIMQKQGTAADSSDSEALNEAASAFAELLAGLKQGTYKPNYIPYAKSIDRNELSMLKEYAQELCKNSDYSTSRFQDFIDISLGDDYAESYEVDSRGPSSSGEFSSLAALFYKETKQAVKKHENDAQLTQSVMQSIMEKGATLQDLDKNTLQYALLDMPDIKWQVFLQVLKDLANEKQKHISAMTQKEKMVFIFELLGMGYASGKLEQKEHSLIKEICSVLELDVEYIDELNEHVAKIYAAYTEALKIINE